MPIYNYKCKNNNCQHVWEQIVTNAAAGFSEPTTCPECSDSDIYRCFPRASTFVLRGSGWYADGYTNKKN
jgi:putative FmdB family regulatory protein